ncbi:hypothetical protein BDA96_03G323200 [Sorghum bicolor]|uniref:Uncharacterized protein n=2 Tax=Sorghum bicolor TaxID=4558 RepID=A0A921RI04_SORBI|nr:hypothetical protein BDA96_03G323200 [Sorghum bicolor]KXG33393.1 hypothetical protein SORBI_3003G299400 [Sorghum bicolor]
MCGLTATIPGPRHAAATPSKLPRPRSQYPQPPHQHRPQPLPYASLTVPYQHHPRLHIARQPGIACIYTLDRHQRPCDGNRSRSLMVPSFVWAKGSLLPALH